VDGSSFRPRGGRAEARQRRSRRLNPDGAMTLVEHLYDLRRRLAIAVLGVLVAMVVTFIWYDHTIAPVPTLEQLIIRPYCHIPADQRAQLFSRAARAGGQSCRLLLTEPFEGFVIRLKVAGAAAAVLSSPVWFNQLWGFITPALREKERRYGNFFVAAASGLFVLGALLAYWVLPHALRVLTGFGGQIFGTALTGHKYFGFMIVLLIVFGVSFEVPLLVVMLNLVGVLKYEKLRRSRRVIIFLLFVFAAVATPGGDPVSMIVLACVLTVLVEIAIQFARVHDKTRAQRRAEAGWDTWNADPDAASELGYSPEATDHTPVPVGRHHRQPLDDDSADGSLQAEQDRYRDVT
jgi:sec-independent protein translocase protein TatC